MLMGDNELLREMRTAKNPREQIRILADLNGTTKALMEEHLRELGVDIPKRRGRKPGAKNKAKEVTPEEVKKVMDAAPAVLMPAGEEVNHDLVNYDSASEADPEDEFVKKDDVVPVSDAIPFILRTAIISTICQMISQGTQADTFKERVTGMLLLLNECEERCEEVAEC